MFLSPLKGSRTTYDVHLGLIGKRVVDFLLVLIKLFFARCYGWGATGENRSKIGVLKGQYAPNFHAQGDIPTNHFCTDSWANECLTTLSLTVFTKRNFIADFLQAKCNFTRKRPFCFFEPPPLGELGATYDDDLRLIGNRVVNFLPISVNWTFFARCSYTAEALQANSDWKSAISLQLGQFDPKFHIKGVAPTNHSSCHKTKVNGLSCGKK